MNVDIRMIPHCEQRYDTSGDWWWEGDTLHVRVSALPGANGWKQSMCVAIHELTEALLCRARGIKESQVDAFDLGAGKRLDEPGDDPRAPYRREHRAAYVPETFLADAFDLDWKAYGDALGKLHWKPKRRKRRRS